MAGASQQPAQPPARRDAQRRAEQPIPRVEEPVGAVSFHGSPGALKECSPAEPAEVVHLAHTGAGLSVTGRKQGLLHLLRFLRNPAISVHHAKPLLQQ